MIRTATAAVIVLAAAMVFVEACEASPGVAVMPAGAQPSAAAPSANFTGSVRVAPLFSAQAPSRASAASVSFEPGARTHWHSHPGGQTLIVVSGIGRVQHMGGPVQEIRTGDVVRIPADVKHWHGAAPDSAMTHIATQESIEGRPMIWMEPVSDEQYSAAPSAPAAR